MLNELTYQDRGWEDIRSLPSQHMPVGFASCIALQVHRPKIIQHMKRESSFQFGDACWEKSHFYELLISQLGIETSAVVYSQPMHFTGIIKHNHITTFQLWEAVSIFPILPPLLRMLSVRFPVIRIIRGHFYI